MIFNCPIYPITDTRSSQALDDQVSEFLNAGASVIQLRAKFMKSCDLFDLARSLTAMAESTGAALLINDRVDIALAAGASGVHLGQEDLHPADARRMLGPKAIIGFSTHSLEQVKEAVQLPVDYIALGPIFKTMTKENPDPVVGTGLLREASELAGSIPIVGIGGIGPENIEQVAAGGAAAAAVIAALSSGQESLSDRFRILHEEWMLKNV